VLIAALMKRSVKSIKEHAPPPEPQEQDETHPSPCAADVKMRSFWRSWKRSKKRWGRRAPVELERKFAARC
jgi:hypothetical protein